MIKKGINPEGVFIAA